MLREGTVSLIFLSIFLSTLSQIIVGVVLQLTSKWLRNNNDN